MKSYGAQNLENMCKQPENRQGLWREGCIWLRGQKKRESKCKIISRKQWFYPKQDGHSLKGDGGLTQWKAWLWTPHVETDSEDVGWKPHNLYIQVAPQKTLKGSLGYGCAQGMNLKEHSYLGNNQRK